MNKNWNTLYKYSFKSPYVSDCQKISSGVINMTMNWFLQINATFFYIKH